LNDVREQAKYQYLFGKRFGKWAVYCIYVLCVGCQNLVFTC
jgi:hypothetical protein